MTSELAALLIILIPFAGFILVPLLNLFAKRLVPVFAVITGLLSAVIAFYLPFGAVAPVKISIEWLPGVIRTGFLLDPLSVVPALISTWIGLLVLIYSLGYMKHEDGLARYYSLTLLFIGSMTAMSLSDNFISLFFFWEVMGVCSYLLIGFFYADKKASDAGVKAFIATKVGDIGLLAAILMLYSQTGSFFIPQNLASASKIALPLLSFISFGFILGAVGKSAQVPLHVWLPDAMEAPTTISALIHAATMVNAGVYLLARVYPVLSLVPLSLATIQWIGALTALLGAFLAAFNYDLKRILAYSTISQLGYMVFAVGIGGVFASQFHLFSHAIFKALLFLCAGSVIHAIGTRDIRGMGGLQKIMPITGTAFIVGALALMGLPFLNGFFSKDLIIEHALKNGSYLPLSIAVAAALLTAFYSIRTTAAVFFGKSRAEKHEKPVNESPVVMTAPLAFLAIASVSSWLLVGRLTSSWKNAGLSGEAFNWKELVEETFSSRSFVLTGTALILGFLLFIYRWPIGNYLREKIPAFFRSTASGLGFDIVYGKFIQLVYWAGAKIRNSWDENVMEGINKFAGSSGITISSLSTKMQTGSIHWNILYVIVALIIIIGAALW